jgi:hypothetical protein
VVHGGFKPTRNRCTGKLLRTCFESVRHVTTSETHKSRRNSEKMWNCIVMSLITPTHTHSAVDAEL